MRNLLFLLGIVCCLTVPALAAETPEATAKRVTSLENANKVLTEDLANTKIELDTTKDDLQAAIDTEAKSREALQASLEAHIAELQKALDAEVAARNQTDKLVSELQTELTNQNLKLATLQADLDKERADRLAADTALQQSVAANTKQDKKDRTITYVMGLILGGLALSK